MKKTFLFLFLVGLCFTVLSQDINRLDNNNGFRKFKFGMTPSQFNKLVVLQTSIKLKDVITYVYSGDDLGEFSGVKIDKIWLSFYNNHLYRININFGTAYTDYTSSEYLIVQTTLEANFSSDYHQCTNTHPDEILNCSIWDGNNVRLEHLRLNQSEPDGTRKAKFKYIGGYLSFTEKSIQLEQQKSEVE